MWRSQQIPASIGSSEEITLSAARKVDDSVKSACCNRSTKSDTVVTEPTAITSDASSSVSSPGTPITPKQFKGQGKDIHCLPHQDRKPLRASLAAQ